MPINTVSMDAGDQNGWNRSGFCTINYKKIMKSL